jgi:transcription elongation factor GreB
VSKAFTKEDDDREPEPPAARPATSAYITPAGHRRLQEELDALWHGERPRVTAEVAAAAALGDRSENAEYIYGKRRLREIDRRIEWLARRLDTVKVVVPAKEQEGKVFFGAWVTVEDEDGEEATYRIVGSDEIDLENGCLSVDSPIARALLGKREGQEAIVARPRGPKTYTIVGIRYLEPTDDRPGRETK